MARESYLRFKTHDTATGRTVVVDIFSVRRGDRLGCIKWYGAWRQYTFYPAAGTIWNQDCLQEIKDKIAELMAERERR